MDFLTAGAVIFILLVAQIVVDCLEIKYPEDKDDL